MIFVGWEGEVAGILMNLQTTRLRRKAQILTLQHMIGGHPGLLQRRHPV
jgi:hypothetical protein